jgi:hypothetical protein
MQETKHVPQFNARSMKPDQLATYSTKLFPTGLRTLAAAIDNDGCIGPLCVFNTPIPVALDPQFVKRVS